VTVTLAIFAGYLAVTVGIGIWSARRGSDDQEDYFLAGRSVPAFAMALSAVSSGRSAWLVLGAGGLAWRDGLSALWVFPGYVLVEALMFVTLGPRLRARSIEVGALTLPEVFARLPRGPRGPGTSRLPLRQLTGAVIVIFLLTYVSAQLVAGGKTLGAIFEGIDGPTTGLVITAGIVLLYTWLGGYRAVVLTDVVQACLMLGGIVLLPLLGLHAVGGPAALPDALRDIDPALLDPVASPAALLGGLAIGLGSVGNPHILVRHMSLRDPREARTALVHGTLWNALMAGGALLLGLVGRALYPTLADLGEGGREVLYPVLAGELSARYLFPGFVGFLLATLFAAIMSTCDSQLLVIASSLLRDLGPTRGAGAAGGRLAGRIAVLVTLTLAVLLTFGESPLVNDLVLLSWFALGCGLGPPLIALLHDPRTGAAGTLAGVLVGVLGVAAVEVLVLRESGGHVSWHAIPVFLASLAATRLGRAPSGASSTDDPAKAPSPR
jgi:SSS family solute:Na+ symporter